MTFHQLSSVFLMMEGGGGMNMASTKNPITQLFCQLEFGGEIRLDGAEILIPSMM